MVTNEQLAQWKAQALQAVADIERTDYADWTAAPGEVLDLIAEVERLRETIKQSEATAAAQSSAIERLRHRQPSDLDERDRTFSHVMPAMDAARKTHGLRERLGE